MMDKEIKFGSHKKLIVAIVAVCLAVSVGLAYAVLTITGTPIQITPIPAPTITPITLTDNGVVTTSPVIGDTVTISATVSDTSSSFNVSGLLVTFLSSPTQTGTYTAIGTATTNSLGVATLNVVIVSGTIWIEPQISAII